MSTFDPVKYKEIEREVYSRTAENYAKYGAPTWFDSGQEGALEKILMDTGFKDIKTNRFDFPLEVKDSEDYWRTNLGVSGRLQMLLKSVPQDVAQKIEDRAKAEAEKYRVGEKLHIPCEEVIGWAEKAG